MWEAKDNQPRPSSCPSYGSGLIFRSVDNGKGKTFIDDKFYCQKRGKAAGILMKGA